MIKGKSVRDQEGDPSVESPSCKLVASSLEIQNPCKKPGTTAHSLNTRAVKWNVEM